VKVVLTEARSFRLEPYFRLSIERDERFVSVFIVTVCPGTVKAAGQDLMRFRPIAYTLATIQNFVAPAIIRKQFQI
jgi:hypothetical protein